MKMSCYWSDLLSKWMFHFLELREKCPGVFCLLFVK